MYRELIRPCLFKIDPEMIHEIVLQLGRIAGLPPASTLLSLLCQQRDPALELELFGLHFSNPVGLAAGFDKNCRALALFSALGFSHLEVGTVTVLPQEGNPRPRIFRLPADAALINRMGFPSDGMTLLEKRLRSAVRRGLSALIGVNIGKGRGTPVDEATGDYLKLFAGLRDCGDYFAVNVSSPNTPDLRKLQERTRLEALLKAIQAVNTEKKPLLVKLAPDLTWQQIDEALEAALSAGLAGVIATNTTIGREGLSSVSSESGGLSGPPLRQRALEIVSYIYRRTEGALPIIGLGGISTADHAWEMLLAGASLVQVYTGFVYEGPLCVKRINSGLLRRMQEQGVKHILDIRGQGLPAAKITAVSGN